MARGKGLNIKRVLACLTAITLVPVGIAVSAKNKDLLSTVSEKLTFISAGTVFGEIVNPNSSNGQMVITNNFDEKNLFSEIFIRDTNQDNSIPIDNSNVGTSGDTGPKPYPEKIDNKSGVISVVNYGKQKGSAYVNLANGGQVKNCTDVSNSKLSAESKLLPEFKIDLNGEPQVLIMHTHTTESYEPYDRDFFDASFNSRTTDESMNMVAVGNEIEKQLLAKGINVIHDKTIHDYPSYNGAYSRSAETVKGYLAKYPSIKIVLDVHRDAISRSDTERVAPVVEINGKKAAQVMIISGCDDGTMNMPNYMKNFRFSCLLQSQTEKDYPGLMRPIMFDYRFYNQNLTTGSILLEMGGHANSIDQAKYSGELIGISLSNALVSIAN